MAHFVPAARPCLVSDAWVFYPGDIMHTKSVLSILLERIGKY